MRMWPAGETAPLFHRFVNSGQERAPATTVASALARISRRPSGDATGAISSPW